MKFDMQGTVGERVVHEGRQRQTDGQRRGWVNQNLGKEKEGRQRDAEREYFC